MNERFYSINEITEMFGVTRTAVYDWMNAGKLDFIVVGARRRVLQSISTRLFRRQPAQR